MREILFRGKSNWADGKVKVGDWLYSMTISRHCYTDEEITSYYIGSGNKTIDGKTLGQYTGLTDKNDKKIFEGDIVKVEYTGVNTGLNGVSKVVFENCKFALVWGWHKEIVCLTDFSNVTFNVIGNIHDNPELLESEG